MTRRQTSLLVALAVLSLVAALGAWWFARSIDAGPEVPVAATSSPALGVAATAESAAMAVGPAAPPPRLDEPWFELPPEAIVNRPDCDLVPGRGDAQGTAVVLVPRSEQETWYAVVDENGVVFGGDLPFSFGTLRDVYVAVGKRPDGSTIAALRSFRDGTVEVVHDGQTIYQGAETWDFDLAPDGSSFVAVEPLAGGSRLVIRNLDAGSEHHHDLDDSVSDGGASLGWRGFVQYAWYSANHTEVIINPNGVEGGTYRFYPVDGGHPREVRTTNDDPDDLRIDVFRSSELSYHVELTRRESGPIRLHRAEHRFPANGQARQSTEVWSREFPPQNLWHQQVSADGAWVVLLTETLGVVLDATSGDTVISVPFKEQALAQHGVPTGVHFLGDRLALFRHKHNKESRDQRFVEIYELLEPDAQGEPSVHTAIDSVPHVRFAGFSHWDAQYGKAEFRYNRHDVDSDAPCAHPVLSDSRILVADGDRLTYRMPKESARP